MKWSACFKAYFTALALALCLSLPGTAAAAERSADASERTAANSAAAANSARAIEQYSASTNFWTIYSALR